MEANTVYIYAEEYRELVEKAAQLPILHEGLEAALGKCARLEEKLAEIEAFFCDKSYYRDMFESWRENRPEEAAAPKPSTDCLTAMAKANWHDCQKAVGDNA